MVNELPAAREKAVTFASLNKLSKNNPQVLMLWAKVLAAVPDSRLVLLAHEGSHRERIGSLFESRGVARQRVRLESPRARMDYLRLYHQIDIALDPFPYGGITTTCDALWMGVPVITLPGTLPTSRAGFSLLSNLGLEHLAAKSPDEFVQTAGKLAGDLDLLAELRSTLRQHMSDSPIMNYPRFARHMESAYRAMWRHWCA